MGPCKAYGVLFGEFITGIRSILINPLSTAQQGGSPCPRAICELVPPLVEPPLLRIEQGEACGPYAWVLPSWKSNPPEATVNGRARPSNAA